MRLSLNLYAVSRCCAGPAHTRQHGGALSCRSKCKRHRTSRRVVASACVDSPQPQVLGGFFYIIPGLCHGWVDNNKCLQHKVNYNANGNQHQSNLKYALRAAGRRHAHLPNCHSRPSEREHSSLSTGSLMFCALLIELTGNHMLVTSRKGFPALPCYGNPQTCKANLSPKPRPQIVAPRHAQWFRALLCGRLPPYPKNKTMGLRFPKQF